MKVLYITPNKFDNSGGGICAENIYNAMRELNIEIDIYSPNNFGIKSIKNKKNDILSRILGHSNFMYIDWKKKKNEILKNKYDSIFLSNSRLGFIAKDLSKSGYEGEIISHFDNIEYDYCDEYAKKYNKIKEKIFKIIEKKNIFRDEKNTVIYSNKLIYLTRRDLLRSKELYGYSMDAKRFIIPICMNNNLVRLKPINNKINFVFIGSLWYGPNSESIKWFVNNVWKKSFINDKNLSLIIAGSKPNEEIIKMNSIKNIDVYPNFSSIEDIIPKNSIFISPIISGAGMKVKIAEALQMGLPIIASKESLIGYEEVNKFDFIIEANDEVEYIKAINEVSKNMEFDNRKICRIFNEYYSIERLKRDLMKVYNL